MGPNVCVIELFYFKQDMERLKRMLKKRRVGDMIELIEFNELDDLNASDDV